MMIITPNIVQAMYSYIAYMLCREISQDLIGSRQCSHVYCVAYSIIHMHVHMHRSSTTMFYKSFLDTFSCHIATLGAESRNFHAYNFVNFYQLLCTGNTIIMLCY